MTGFIRAMVTAVLCAGAALTAAGAAQAQAQTPYPNRPIRMVVPFPAGGPTDGMARIISERLGAVLGQSIVSRTAAAAPAAATAPRWSRPPIPMATPS
jgi:tripartite-type tricarboxylate transporter receptor subunit TctC